MNLGKRLTGHIFLGVLLRLVIWKVGLLILFFSL